MDLTKFSDQDIEGAFDKMFKNVEKRQLSMDRLIEKNRHKTKVELANIVLNRRIKDVKKLKRLK